MIGPITTWSTRSSKQIQDLFLNQNSTRQAGNKSTTRNSYFSKGRGEGHVAFRIYNSDFRRESTEDERRHDVLRAAAAADSDPGSLLQHKVDQYPDKDLLDSFPSLMSTSMLGSNHKRETVLKTPPLLRQQQAAQPAGTALRRVRELEQQRQRVFQRRWRRYVLGSEHPAVQGRGVQ